MVTLHGHVLRELLKTFALTLVALTALFTMGGGLYNVLKYEGIGAADLLRFIPLMVPIVVALTMPVAALFSVTMVYGRLAADNELLACRAAGINIHRLFLSAILLSVFVAGFSLFFGDLVMPDFVRRVDRYARANLRDIAFTKLQVMGYVRYEKSGNRYLLTARRVRIPTDEALAQQNLPQDEGITYLLVDEPVFLQIDNHDNLVRQASAAHGLCQFDARTTPLEITIYVDNGREFDVTGRSVSLQQQQIGPIMIPLQFPRKSSMVDLATLLRWRRRPWEVDKLEGPVRNFLTRFQTEYFFTDAASQLNAGQTLTLQDDEGQTFRITAPEAVGNDASLLLRRARIEIPGDQPQRPLFYDAPEALLRPRPMPDGGLRLALDLREAGGEPVREHHPRASDYEQGRPKRDAALGDTLQLPPDVLTRLQPYDAKVIFDTNAELPLSETLATQRAKLLDDGQRQRRKMTSVIHFRLASACSVLVTVLMAAALGVMFRGARALAAFGLACIPFGTVAVLLVMARQLGEKAGGEMLGPALTWGGLAAVAVIDLVLLRLGVRR
ncbi:MAG: LptF/LptG family permease [Phycisphaerae bacterium]